MSIHSTFVMIKYLIFEHFVCKKHRLKHAKFAYPAKKIVTEYFFPCNKNNTVNAALRTSSLFGILIEGTTKIKVFFKLRIEFVLASLETRTN